MFCNTGIKKQDKNNFSPTHISSSNLDSQGDELIKWVVMSGCLSVYPSTHLLGFFLLFLLLLPYHMADCSETWHMNTGQ